MKSSTVSLGIVGLGSFGGMMADLFASHPLVGRIALCDREPERIAAFATKPSCQKKFSAEDAYDSLDAICRSDLDAIALFTQHWLHAPQAIQALESGKHVYSAVPIIWIPDADEILEWCDKLVATVRRTGQHYMLGETTYFHAQAMYCRRQAAAGAFGDFVYSEGEYFHDVDDGCNLRDVMRMRYSGKAGQEWLKVLADYKARGILGGPMHYPTHSTSGPMSVMNAHAVKVSCHGYKNRTGDGFFAEHGDVFSNETALFHMSNGSTMRICEHREIGMVAQEGFRLYGTKGSFAHDKWMTNRATIPVTVEQMRDALPPEVETAFKQELGEKNYLGGHGGSHAYLVHEFVSAIAADRMPAINVWEAARYTAAGAVAHKSALKDGELLTVPDWGDAPK
jgi:predicted dehydrogenase